MIDSMNGYFLVGVRFVVHVHLVVHRLVKLILRFDVFLVRQEFPEARGKGAPVLAEHLCPHVRFPALREGDHRCVLRLLHDLIHWTVRAAEHEIQRLLLNVPNVYLMLK